MEALTEQQKGQLDSRLKRYKWCTVCSGGCIRKEGWSHKTRQGHEMRALRQEEKEQVKADFLREVQGGAVVRAEIFVEQRALRTAQDSEVASSCVAAALPETEYRMEFGAFRKKTVREVVETERGSGDGLKKMQMGGRGYLAWCISSSLHTRYPHFHAALKKLGLWESLQSEAVSVGKQIAERDLIAKEVLDVRLAAGDVEHKDVIKMRAKKAEQAALTLAKLSEQGTSSAIVPYKKQQKPRRPHRSRALVLLNHCGHCGKMGHRKTACPSLRAMGEDALVVKPIGVVTPLQKQIWRLVAHLKYTWPQNRTDAYESKPVKRCRGDLGVGYDEIKEMTERQLMFACFDWGLLFDLTGRPCIFPECVNRQGVYSKGCPSVLGRPSVRKAVVDKVKLFRKWDAWYKCRHCRQKYSICVGHPLFSVGDSIDQAVRAFWCFVNDVPMSAACFMMKRREDLMRQYYRVARLVCESDAVRRQQEIKWGGRYPLTTTIEADESRFGKYEDVVDGVMRFYSWVIIAVITRGDPSGLWLKEYGVAGTKTKTITFPSKTQKGNTSTKQQKQKHPNKKDQHK
jgi:hypothetical protein